MENIKKLLMRLLAFLVISTFFVSCSDNDEMENSDEKYEIDANVEKLSSELFDTNWLHQKTIIYTSRTGEKETLPSTGFTLNLSSEVRSKGKENQLYVLGINGNTNPDVFAYWYIDDNGFNCLLGQRFYEMGYSATEVGRLGRAMPFMEGAEIEKHTSSELVLKKKSEYGYTQVYYTRLSNNTGNTGGTTDGEAPIIELEDYTEYIASGKIKLVYRFSSDATVTSASVYKGTTSNPSTSVSCTKSGTTVTATVSGLVSGQTYYFKAKATNKYGTGESSVFKYYYYKY